jgi:hypothetical protein
MIMVKINTIVKKFEEYGMNIFTDYPTDKEEHCFMVDNMIVYLDKEDNSVAISFVASAKPEEVARNVMILNELNDLKQIYIMESFVYDMNDKFISGDDAHNLVKKTIEHDALKDFVKRQAYTEVLVKSKCFKC